METSNVSLVFEKLVTFNNALNGLPAMPFIVVACILLGYVLKLIPVIKNEWIPSWVLFASITSYVFMMPLPEQSTSTRWLIAGWLARNILMGMISGALAILIHRKGLKKLEDKYGWFADEDDSNKP